MKIKHNGSVTAEAVPRATGAEIQWLIDRHDGAPNFELRKFKIKPNGLIPRHYHPDIEHEQYVLKGEYVVGIGDETYNVKPGDSIFIPAGTPHWYKNNSETDAEFLCIIPKVESYQSIYQDEVEGAPIANAAQVGKTLERTSSKDC
jgi:quercetin dioxygenase-like cupin family protein